MTTKTESEAIPLVIRQGRLDRLACETHKAKALSDLKDCEADAGRLRRHRPIRDRPYFHSSVADATQF